MIRTVLLVILILMAGLSGYSQNHLSIIQAIESGNLESFKQEVGLLDDLNEPLVNGYTILNYSIIRERRDFVDYLLTKDIDIEKESGNQTPLMYSAGYQSGILEILISKGADVNREIDGITALEIALQEDNQPAVDILTSNSATIEMRGGVDGPYILYDTTLRITTIVTVNEQNKLLVDTLRIAPTEIVVKAPFDESFKVRLKRLKMERKSVFKNPEKIFAISDIEGNYYDFVTSLKNNGIIDENLTWKFGEGHLVLLGDFVDRGEYVTQVLWLIYKLEQEAKKAGGKVHYTLGNHEIMILSDYFHYAHIRYKILGFNSGIDLYDFFSDQSELGAWLRTKNIVEKIGDNVFVHAGISDSVYQLNLSIPKMNRIARQNLAVPLYEPIRGTDLIYGSYSPLWYRGYISGNDGYKKISQESLDKILGYYDAKRFIIGHSIVEDISTDYDGKVIRIDVNHYTNIASGIFIEGDKIYKAYETGRKELLLE